MRVWDWIKDELRFIITDDRGGKGGGDAPKERPPTQEEIEQTRAVTELYKQQGEAGRAMMPWEVGGRQYEAALLTGQMYPFAQAPVTGTVPGVVGMPVTGTQFPATAAATPYAGAIPAGYDIGVGDNVVEWLQRNYGMPQEHATAIWNDMRSQYPLIPQSGTLRTTGGTAGLQTALMQAASGYSPQAQAVPKPSIPGVPTTGTMPTTGTTALSTQAAAAPQWFQDLSSRGGLMGLTAQLGAGMGRAGEPGTQYGFGGELESALGGTAQFLQNKGLLGVPGAGGSGLMQELATRRAGEIAERTEAQRRQEQMALLGRLV